MSKKRKFLHNFKYEFIILIIFSLFLFLFWNSPIIFPIKLFSVLMHEFSHAIVAILTGGTVEHIEIGFNLGGKTVVSGGSKFLIALAGYSGSIATGFLLFMTAYNPKFNKIFTTILSVVIFVLTVNFVSDHASIITSLFYSLLLFISPRFFKEPVNGYLMKLFAFTSVIYVATDIVYDVFNVSIHVGDAEILSDLTGIAPAIWGIIWLILDGITIYYFYFFGTSYSLKKK